MLPALDVRHLSKSYLAGVAGCCAVARVLVDVTLQVRAGEIVGVCGAAGAGKTTLLHCAAGVLAPDRGEVRWFGATASRDGRRESGVVFVAGCPAHLRFLSAREALEQAAERALGADDTAGPAPRLPAEVPTLLRRVGLGRVARRRVGSLSRGALVRLEIGRALAERPRLLLVDAPLEGLDRRWRASVALLLRAVAADGVACLVTAREHAALRDVADRIVTLVGGHAADGRSGTRGAERGVPASWTVFAAASERTGTPAARVAEAGGAVSREEQPARGAPRPGSVDSPARAP